MKRNIISLFLMLTFIFTMVNKILATENATYILREVKVVAPVKYEELEKISQEVKVIEKGELINYGIESFSSLQLNERGGFGVQADLSLRGISFEQNLIALEGIRLSDPQTGHHLTNLPFETNILENVEILSGGASAIYGLGGFGGVINFNLEPSKPGYLFDFCYGSYDYKSIFGKLGFNTTFSPFNIIFSQKKSHGFIWNRDFDIRVFNFYIKDKKKTIFYGFQEKDFGARNFYTFKYNTEWEETRTHLFLAKTNFYGINWFFEPAILYRINYDTYLLDRRNPDFYKNYHKSQTLRFNLPLRYETKLINYIAGIEVSYETLDSTRLGDHLRQSFGFYLWFYPQISSKIFPSLGIRYDSITKNKDMFSYHIGIAYLLKQDLKFRSALNFSYRIPSFTELYYDSPYCKGNKALSPEKAYNFEIGFDYNSQFLSLLGTIFYRYGKDIIDWIKRDGIIQANNIETLKTFGFTFDGKFDFKKFKPFISYTYLNQVAKELPKARYQGSYLRHNLILGFSVEPLKNIKFAGSINYRNYYLGDEVFLINLRVEKILKNWDLSLWVKNLLDEEYEEVRGVKAEPEWWGISLKVEF